MATEPQILESIALNPTWMRLIHIEERTAGQYITDVRSKSFYLSDEPLNPIAELKATVKQFNQVRQGDKPHPICQFPARYYWLNYHFPELLTSSDSLNECSDLKQWPAIRNSGAINLVHVSGYMGNPGSAFGHLLLRIGKKYDSLNRGLLDTGVNFGAKIPPDENTLLYIIKGIGGGYDSSFSADRHYLRDHVYAESESRDMWAYELNLDEYQRQLLLLHLWELRNTAFNYFFLKKNCAWRIAQLFELVLRKPILPTHRLYYMPVDVFHAIEQLDKASDGKLVNKISFLPSEKRANSFAFQQLPASSQERFRHLIKQPQTASIDSTWTVAELDILIDFSAQKIKDHRNTRELESWQKIRLQSLKHRLKQGPSTPQTNVVTMPPPGEGLRHQIFELTTIQEDGQKKSIDLSFAPFSYEALDRNRGSLANGVFRGGVFTFSYQEGHTKLKSLEVINVARLRGQASIESRSFDFAWRSGLFLNRTWRENANELTPQFNAAVGKTISHNKSSFYALLEFKSELKNLEAKLGVAIGAVAFASSKLSFQWESSQFWHQDIDTGLIEHAAQARYRLNRVHALDAGYTRQSEDSWQLGYQYRW